MARTHTHSKACDQQPFANMERIRVSIFKEGLEAGSVETQSHPRGSNEGVFVTGGESNVCVCVCVCARVALIETKKLVRGEVVNVLYKGTN